MNNKKFSFVHPVIVLNKVNYPLAVIIIAPLLNFMFGISIDLYAPSLPEIATYFNTTAIIAKQTLVAVMLGYCIGCFVLGPMMDSFGRRKIISISLLGFVFVSLLAIFAQKADQLSLVRLLQGVLIAASSIGSRVLIFDNFTGKRYVVGIIYTSLAYALGPIIAPFIGGWLQYLYGWKSAFVVYAILSFIVFILFFLFIKEPNFQRKPFKWRSITQEYWRMSTNKYFLSGAVISGIIFFQVVGFSLLGSYFYSKRLNVSSVLFGYSALVLGLSYLIGSLVNRMGTKYFTTKQLSIFGFFMLNVAVILYLIISLGVELSIPAIVLPNIFILFSVGFIFPNVLSESLKIFPTEVGVATATQSMLFMGVGTMVNSIANRLEMHSILEIAVFYIILVAIQNILFFRCFIKIFKGDAISS
ncbi:MAG: MFS transporter [Legionellaceae bacterium]|nr:MFS transporter [Legionellaceae bacterium]